jgi:cyclophilin family peptidyl-prolyl cis-trans isomerase
MASASGFTLKTELGEITLRFRNDSAPETTLYIEKLIKHKLYDGASFYRSDFVIQCGTHGLNRANPEGDLKVNETHQHKIVSNTRGTAAIAHWDVPDCGNSEFFINLSANAHLDSAYGGYCVFAEVDAVSFKIVDAIADAIANQQKKMVRITSVMLV